MYASIGYVIKFTIIGGDLSESTKIAEETYQFVAV